MYLFISPSEIFSTALQCLLTKLSLKDGARMGVLPLCPICLTNFRFLSVLTISIET